MPTPRPTPEQLKSWEGAINDSLRDGYRPLGQQGGKGSAIEETVRRLGQASASTLIKYIRLGQINPGWTLYHAPEQAPIPPLDIPQPSEKPRVRVQAGRPGGSKIKILVIGDAHDHPNIPKDRFRWMGKFAAAERPDVIVQIGDFATLDSLNSHIPDETFAGRLKGTFLDDLASLTEAMGEFNTALPSGYAPRKWVTLGNHEERIWRSEDNAPHVAGMMVQAFTDVLDRHKWGWSRFGAYEFIGGVGFTHVPLSEMGRPMGGKTSELRISNELCYSLVFGHTHKRRSWRAAKLGPFQHVTVINAGCALPYGHTEDFAKHHLTGWSWGVDLLTIQGSHIIDENFVSMLDLEERFA